MNKTVRVEEIRINDEKSDGRIKGTSLKTLISEALKMSPTDALRLSKGLIPTSSRIHLGWVDDKLSGVVTVKEQKVNGDQVDLITLAAVLDEAEQYGLMAVLITSVFNSSVELGATELTAMVEPLPVMGLTIDGEVPPEERYLARIPLR